MSDDEHVQALHAEQRRQGCPECGDRRIRVHLPSGYPRNGVLFSCYQCFHEWRVTLEGEEIEE